MNFEFSKGVELLFESHDAMSLLELIDHMNEKYNLYTTYEMFSWEYNVDTKDFSVFNKEGEQLAIGIVTEFELPEFEIIFMKNEFEQNFACLGIELDEYTIDAD